MRYVHEIVKKHKLESKRKKLSTSYLGFLGSTLIYDRNIFEK